MATALSGIRVARSPTSPRADRRSISRCAGRRLVKVEAPQQDVNRYAVRHPDGLQGISPYFLATNRNQRVSRPRSQESRRPRGARR